LQHTGASSNEGISDQKWEFATYTEKLRIPGRLDALFYTSSISVIDEVQTVSFSSGEDYLWHDSEFSM